MPNGLLIVVSAPPAAARAPYSAELLGKNDGFCYSVSATSARRGPANGTA
ncbi:MAG: hypothetical protein ACLUFV_03700 [Acutalibacteraceae bacterium]